MTRRLVITDISDNPEFDKQLETYEDDRKRNQWSGNCQNVQYPSRTIESESLRVELTDAEYAAVKRAVLEVK